MTMIEYRKTNFALFALGRLVSLIGAGIQMIALPLYILDITGSGTAMGFFTLLSIIPRLAATPFAGVLGDRWNRKKIMVNTDYGHGLILYGLGFLSIIGKMNIGFVFGGTVILSIFDAFFSGATSGMLPDIVPEANLKKANSTMGFVSSISRIIGPIIGGIIYGFVGIRGVFFINATCFTLSAFSEMFIVYHPELRKDRLTLSKFFIDIKEGAEFVFRKRGLKYLFIFAMLINFVSTPIFSIVYPYVLKTVIRFSSQQYGYLQSAFILGALIGNLLIIKFLLKASNKKMIVGGLFAEGLLQYVFIFSLFQPVFGFLQSAIWLYFSIIGALFAISGMFNTFVNVPIDTNLQIMTPTEIRSRVFSVLELLAQIMVPVGSVIYGFLLDRVSIQWFLVSVNTVSILLSLIFYIVAPAEVYNPHLEKTPVIEHASSAS
jgi:MFS family permease